jgi:chromosome segregation ATPase
MNKLSVLILFFSLLNVAAFAQMTEKEFKKKLKSMDMKEVQKKVEGYDAAVQEAEEAKSKANELEAKVANLEQEKADAQAKVSELQEKLDAQQAAAKPAASSKPKNSGSGGGQDIDYNQALT